MCPSASLHRHETQSLEVLESIKDNFEKSPGAMAKNYTIDNSSLLDLLSVQNLEVNKIQTISRELGKKLSSTASSGQTNNNETLSSVKPEASSKA